MSEVEGIFEVSWASQSHCRLHAPLEIAQESEWQAEPAGEGLSSSPCAHPHPHPPPASAALQVLSGMSKGLVNIKAGGEMAEKMT